jgi:ABC-type Fe3+ transport system substrate-binding protein
MAVLLAVLLVLALAGCGGVGTGAQTEEDKVVAVCSSMNRDLSRALTDDFANRTGIIVEFEPLASQGLIQRLDALSRSTVDVWMGGTAEEYYRAGERKMLVPYHPVAAANIPPEYQDREGQWTPLSIDRIALLSNRNVTDRLHVRPPETWIELLQPVLHKETVMAVPEAGGASYGMITTLWQLRGRDKALQYAGLFRTQEPVYVPTDSKAAYAVFRGDKAVAVLPLRHARMLEKEHRFLNAVAVKDGNKNLITAAAILQRGKHRKAAERFMEYLLSPEAGRIMLDYGFTPLTGALDRQDRTVKDRMPVCNDDLRWAATEKQNIIKTWLNAM